LRQVPYAPFLLPFLFVDRPFPYGWLVSFHPGYRTLMPDSLESFDICQIDHPAFVDLLKYVPRHVPVIYSAHNVELDYISDECRSALVRSIVSRRIRALEARLVARANHIFTCTIQDARRLRELYGINTSQCTVLPNGLQLPAGDPPAANASAPTQSADVIRRAIFVGSNVQHNRVAVRTILSRIAPALEKEVEFVILGSCARRFRETTNVRLHVEGDIKQYVGPGAVGVNPVTTGSGSNMKILRYLSCELPVISTPFGMRGFEDLAPWVTVSDVDHFANALRVKPQSTIGVRARLSSYSWSRIAEKAFGVYQALAPRH
jgi:hypothetical protein